MNILETFPNTFYSITINCSRWVAHIESLTNTFPLGDPVHCLGVTRLVAELEAFARDLPAYFVSRRKLCNPIDGDRLALGFFVVCLLKLEQEWYLRKGKNTIDQGGRELN